MTKVLSSLRHGACVGLVVAAAWAGASAFGAAPAESRSASRTDPLEALIRAPPPFVLPPPFILAPQPWPSAMLVPVPSRSWMPPAGVPAKPRPLASEPQPPLRPRPAADLPPVASPSDAAGVVRRPMPVGPLAYAPSQDVDALPMRMSDGRPFTDRATAATDPTVEPSRLTVLSVVPPYRRAPAPFLRLMIPDPFELVTPLKLRRTLPDGEGPASAPSLFPKPKLPMKL
jgi:hypothetical protein